MKSVAFLLSIALVAAPCALIAQSSSSSLNLIAAEPALGGSGGQAAPADRNPPSVSSPFSKITVGGGVSSLGINLLVATNINRYLDVRATGNVFQYSINNLKTNGINIDGNLNLASAGVSADLYPFPGHGFRLSPGVLFYNNNNASATATVPAGTSIKLNGNTYYAAPAPNQITGTATLGLDTYKAAFTITAGTRSIIPLKHSPLSFPFAIGVAIIGDPSLNIAFNQGDVCTSPGEGCYPVDTANSTFQTDLQTQVAKFQKDLNPLNTYPILSLGVAWTFHAR